MRKDLEINFQYFVFATLAQNGPKTGPKRAQNGPILAQIGPGQFWSKIDFQYGKLGVLMCAESISEVYFGLG